MTPTAYGRVAFTVQVPIAHFPLRPSLTLSGMELTNRLQASTEIAMLELGITWQAF